MSKYSEFSDWLDEVLERFGISAGDIISSSKEYEIRSGNDVVAYWDRQYKFGFVDKQ